MKHDSKATRISDGRVTDSLSRRHFVAGLTAAGIGNFAHANEPAYPIKAVTITIGFPPGTATDVLARMLAEGLSTRLGQPFIVDNRAGMGGSIGASYVARAKPDGYTLVIGATAPISINPHIYPSLSYQPEKDFTPIASLIWIPLLLVTAPSVKADSLQQLIAMARSEPGKLSFASTGNGTTSHLLMEMLTAEANVKLTHIPYKGSAQAQTDIIGGRVTCSFDTLASALPLVRAGKLKALAVSTPQRTSALPNVPTVAEQGFPGFGVVAWTGMLAPKGTPPAVIDQLARALKEINEDPGFREKMIAQGNEVRPQIAKQEFQSFLQHDYDSWGKVVSQFNVKIE